MMGLSICRQCGNQWRPPTRREHYCSEHCRAAGKRQMAEQRNVRLRRRRGMLTRDLRTGIRREQAEIRREQADTTRPPNPNRMADLRRQIAAMVRTVEAIDARLSKPWCPWHNDGCTSRKAWKASFPDRHYQYASFTWRQSYLRWRYRLRATTGSWDFWQWVAKVKEYGSRCAYCGSSRQAQVARGHELEADHIFGLNLPEHRPDLAPLCTNEIQNIAPACKACNSSKCDRYVLAWLDATGRRPLVHPLIIAHHDRGLASLSSARASVA